MKEQCLYIANKAVLPIYSAGKNTGIVVDSGEVTDFVPIFDGFALPYGIRKLNIGGKDLTKYFCDLLSEIGYHFTTPAEKEIVKTIKEKSCYVALDFEDQLKYVEPYSYELPDQTHVVVKNQRIRCPEALFNPSLIRNDEIGIGNLCYYSIQNCGVSLRRVMYNNIVLSGGNSMFDGPPERLCKEIKHLAPESFKEEVKVIASPERKFATWIGGSILSRISTFESCWITKTEYEEYGDTIVHRKCF